MRIFNYSKFKKNDKRIYNIGGYSIPGGIDVMLLVSALACCILVNLLVYPICKACGVKYFDFANNKYMLGTLMIILPMVAGGMISKMKIKQISLYSYIIEFFKYLSKPKNQSLRGEKSTDHNVTMSFGVDDPI